MSGKMNRASYEKLIAEDIDWLHAVLRQLDSHGPNPIVRAGHMTNGALEHRHIIDVLRRSIETEYPDDETALARSAKP